LGGWAAHFLRFISVPSTALSVGGDARCEVSDPPTGRAVVAASEETLKHLPGSGISSSTRAPERPGWPLAGLARASVARWAL